jgi:hypothetical protein
MSVAALVSLRFAGRFQSFWTTLRDRDSHLSPVEIQFFVNSEVSRRVTWEPARA